MAAMLQIRQAARELVRRAGSGEDREPTYVPEHVVQGLLSTTLESLQDVTHDTGKVIVDQIYEDMLVVEACLRNPQRVDMDTSAESAATWLQRWTVSAILPTNMVAKRSQFNPSPLHSIKPDEIVRWRAMAAAGLRLLSHLHGLTPSIVSESSVEMFLCLAAFTDERDQWTSPEAFEEAKTMLENYVDLSKDGTVKAQALITRTLLTEIKPLFAKTKNPAITQQGRKAIRPIPGAPKGTDLENESKPWKFHDIHIITVFRWLLMNLDASTIEENWPLIIPPLLALIDDETTEFKVKGCELLLRFLELTPSALLQRTGLGEVFQEALMPCLSYMPTLTPEEESLLLLSAVYPALLALVRVRFFRDGDRQQKMSALDKILRLGVLKGYAHAGGYVKIAELLVREMAILVDEMGIMSVKHMKDLIPLLSGILSAPFAMAYPPLLLAATRALQVIILNDWPRIECYNAEILKGLTICWCRSQESKNPSNHVPEVQSAIRTTLDLLKAAIDNEAETAKTYEFLVASNARLRNLLLA